MKKLPKYQNIKMRIRMPVVNSWEYDTFKLLPYNRFFL